MKTRGKIPITIGIVGHLDAITTDDHKVQIMKIFTDLASACPNSPLYFFSSLAEGADRFVAQIFLDFRNSRAEYNKCRLIVPTPLENEEYKNDFDNESDREYNHLLNQADQKFCAACEGGKKEREDHYLETGKFIADSSLILLAMWDGKPGKKGGTADIVNYKKYGEPGNIGKSTFEYEGSVSIIPCRRKNCPEDESLADNDSLSLANVLKDTSIKETLEKIEEINSDTGHFNGPDDSITDNLLIDHPADLNLSQKSVLDWFNVLDSSSLRFHRRYMNTIKSLFILGFLTVVSLAVYTNLWLDRRVLALSVFLIASASAIYIISRRTNDHGKYLYTRTLAEALRIQFYWSLSGIRINVSDHILRIHRKEFTWIEHLLSSLYGASYHDEKPAAESAWVLLENWVRNQCLFFDKAIKRMTAEQRKFTIMSNICLVAGCSLLISIFFLEEFYVSGNYMNTLQVIITSLLSFFALMRAYIEMKGYNQLLKQYELMNILYGKAEVKLKEILGLTGDTEMKEKYLRELFTIIGKEALIENGNWYLILKEKEPGIEGI